MGRLVRDRIPRASALALALVLAGCRARDAAPTTTLVLGQPTSALTLDPHLHDEESTYTTLEHFYERLVAFGRDMELVPELALTWQNPSDTLWRIRLRKGVVFHDGRPCEAEDVAASIRRARSLPGSKVAHYLESVVDVRAPDPGTVEIVTGRPSPVLLNKLAFVAVVPRDTPLVPVARPVGTGPYRFLRGGPGAPIEGERFERWWGGRPHWDRVRILSFPDAAGRARAVAAGAADAVSRFPYEMAGWAEGEPSLRLVAHRGIGVTILGFDTRPPSPFADPGLRRAVAALVDRAALASGSPGSHSIPMDQLVPPGIFGHIPEGLPAGPGAEEARRLLAAARPGRHGPVALTFADTHADLGRGLARQLTAAGFPVTPEPLPQPVLYARFANGPPLLFLMTWAAGTGDASDVLEALFHTPNGAFGTANRFGYSRPEVDELVARSGRTLDPGARRDALQAAFRLLAEDVPAVPLVLRASLYAIRPDLEWTPLRNRRLRAVDIRPAPAR